MKRLFLNVLGLVIPLLLLVVYDIPSWVAVLICAANLFGFIEGCETCPETE